MALSISICFLIYFFIYLFNVFLFKFIFQLLSIYLSIYLSICLFVSLCFYSFLSLSLSQYCYLSHSLALSFSVIDHKLISLFIFSLFHSVAFAFSLFFPFYFLYLAKEKFHFLLSFSFSFFSFFFLFPLFLFFSLSHSSFTLFFAFFLSFFYPFSYSLISSPTVSLCRVSAVVIFIYLGSLSSLLGIVPGSSSFGHLIKPISFLLCVSASHHHCLWGMESPPPSLKFHLGLFLLGHLINPIPLGLGVV
ncbi:unnamed protein product [Acanthosepion pharaonis]|uniref:Uncharacterized protein n=1 Tax=Acanthosepion pharaonis TaxID=158019 RepID=A0A812DV23_ACAPH|nr:unnamed protein product [Sepia pharaonis]